MHGIRVCPEGQAPVSRGMCHKVSGNLIGLDHGVITDRQYIEHALGRV